MKTALSGILGALLVVTTAMGQQQPAARGRPRPGAAPADPNAATAVVKMDAASVADRKTEAKPVDVSGKWTGVFCSDNVVLLANLELVSSDAAKRKYTGEVKFTSVAMAAARAAAPMEGSWKVNGAVGPAMGLVVLERAGWVKQPAGIRMVSWSGVYAADRKMIAGQATGAEGRDVPTQLSMPFFLFVRDEEAGGAAGMKALAEHAAEAMALPRLPGAGVAVPASDEAIGKWADAYEAEYPNSMSQGAERIGNQGLPLMNDATFKRVFGESYDTIDLGKLALAMQRVGGPVQQPARAAAAARAPRNTGDAEQGPAPVVRGARVPLDAVRALQPAGGAGAAPAADRPDPAFVRKYNYAQYLLKASPTRIVAVAAMRVIDAWRGEMLTHFEKDGAVATGVDDLAAAEAVMEARAEYVWPSEKKEWAGTFAKLRTGMGGATLAANIEKALQTPGTMEGAKMLADWPRVNAVLLRSAPAAEGAEARKKVEGKLDGILEQLLAGKRAEVAKLGNGMEGIHAGVGLYQGLTKEYGFVMERAPVQVVMKELVAKREGELHAGAGDFVKKIQASKTVDEVDGMVKGELSVPGDAGLKDFGVIAKAAADKKMQLDRDHMMSLFTKDEQDLMDRPGHIDLKKGEGKAPTAEDVRMAMLRGFAGTTGKVIDEHNALSVTRSQSFGVPYTLNVKLSEEKMTGFMPVEKTKDFECHFEILIEMTIPKGNIIASYDANTVAGSAKMAEIANGLAKAMAKTEHVQVLRLYEDGWGIPEMRDRAAAEGALQLYLQGGK